MAYTRHPVIPEHERRCIWMDAGIMPYKLCDNEFQCATCWVDAQIRVWRTVSHPTDEAAEESAAAPSQRMPAPHTPQTVDEMCAEMMDNLLGGIGALRLPDDRLYASDHIWAKKGSDDSYTIGVDHFVGAMLSGMQSVACSPASTHITASHPCAWIVANGETLAVRSPLSGVIIECNAMLAAPSSALHTDPYGVGWIARIRPDAQADCSALRTEKETRERLKKDSEKFRRSMHAELEKMQAQLEGTMNDGGTLLDRFEDILGAKAYYRIVERFLGAPSPGARRRR